MVMLTEADLLRVGLDRQEIGAIEGDPELDQGHPLGIGTGSIVMTEEGREFNLILS